MSGSGVEVENYKSLQIDGWTTGDQKSLYLCYFSLGERMIELHKYL